MAEDVFFFFFLGASMLMMGVRTGGEVCGLGGEDAGRGGADWDVRTPAGREEAATVRAAFAGEERGCGALGAGDFVVRGGTGALE